MIKLEDLKPGMRVCGLAGDHVVRIVTVKPRGASHSSEFKLRVVYEDDLGDMKKLRVLRENEADLFEAKDEWALGKDAELGALAWEGRRIRDAHLFDPWHAVHISDIEPLPHQIVAVYDDMLNRQPLRFLLADDPGAGKTIMAGLLIRELIARDDVQRCLICVPGKLQDQWQRELREKFGLPFTIYAHETYGNPFLENDMVIVSIDRAKREKAWELLAESEWDLVVCDEAHKMAATYSGGEISYTARYRLGELLSRLTRHYLLMTATPHNGKDEDFKLFMRLLDEDRFSGRMGERGTTANASDLYRRMMKEELCTFDGKRLFPERKAYSVDYELSDPERDLYEKVTEYIRNEFNRADRLHGGRKSSIGFALTILQRRLASSPEAMYQSLKTRRQTLQSRLQDWQIFLAELESLNLDSEAIDDMEDMTAASREEKEMKAMTLATAAQTPAELQKEIDILRDLEAHANRVRRSDVDSKWRELRRIWQVQIPEMETEAGSTRKLIIFTEWRATIDYLVKKLGDLLGDPAAIVTIHGGMPMDKRRIVESIFRDDPRVQILVANDAAGEGINLQCAHLMVNYDLPWNPNRLEQRFGRIHRIGQTEVCHLWNLVSGETREGAVYSLLLEKLANEANALDGKVFDVLGELFQQQPLRELLVDAVRYGDDPLRTAEFRQIIDNTLERDHVKNLVQDRMLVTENIDISRLQSVMKNAVTGRLQSRDTREFLLRVFDYLPHSVTANSVRTAVNGYVEVLKVPGVIREAAELKGIGNLRSAYPMICFDRAIARQSNGRREAEFVSAGHPLLQASIAWIETRWDKLRPECGTLMPVLIDENAGRERAYIRAVYFVEWTLSNDVPRERNRPQLLNREARFIETDGDERFHEVNAAPYLRYRPAAESDLSKIHAFLDADWLNGEELDESIEDFAEEMLVVPSRDAIEARERKRISREMTEVTRSLDSRIEHELGRERHFAWLIQTHPDRSQVYNASKTQHVNSRLEYEARKMRRLNRWEQESNISYSGPTVRRVAIIIPASLLQT